MGQIFISYSRADKDFVDRLARDIEAVEPHDVWTDRADIAGGEDWYTAISRAIRGCSAFLLVLSPNSNDSVKVAEELSLADKHRRNIVPVMCESCEVSVGMELPLSRRQTIDFTEGYDVALGKLLAVLGSPRPEPPPTKPEPRPTRPEPQGDEGAPPRVTTTNVVKEQFSAPPPPRQPELTQMLVGQWTITINFPMMPPFTLTVWLGPDGTFRAQLPTGAFAQGGWSVNFGNQVVMQGVESFGMMSRPFYGHLNVTDYGPHHLNGFGPQGEPVFWRRSG